MTIISVLSRIRHHEPHTCAPRHLLHTISSPRSALQLSAANTSRHDAPVPALSAEIVVDGDDQQAQAKIPKPDCSNDDP
ncbi:hypothetical protein TB2_021638 [Malus domestica]